MLAPQRHAVILDLIRRRGGVRIRELVSELGVSDMTVRRDLEALADRGLIAKVHGGATVLGPASTAEPGFAAKATRQRAEKAAIAARAAQLVKPDTAIALSAGTTTAVLAEHLLDVPGVTVVTNSIPVADLFYRSGGDDRPAGGGRRTHHRRRAAGGRHRDAHRAGRRAGRRRRAGVLMKRSVTRLSDGRQLIYFDEQDPEGERPDDKRDLAPLRSASELRYDPVVDECVTIAAHRQDRTHLPPDHECPLCPSTPDKHTEIPAHDYDVVVFENRFPVLSHLDVVSTVDLPVPIRPGVGRCEVICYTADHDSSFAELTPERVRTVVDVWADRTAELSELPGVEQVLCFENRGEEIGVTLRHPHGQVYALPFVAPRTARMLAAARRRGAGFMADLLAAERASGVRVVAANEHWTAFVPAAARWPFEVHVYPVRRAPDISFLDDAQRDAFAPLYLDLLRRLDALFGVPMPYVAAWHQAPVRLDRELAHLYLQLFSIRRAPSKLKYVAATESAMGVFSNDVLPEEAARMMREVLP